ncbi:hypothetical protein AGR13a_Lc30106 [Agrobacterium genomosp. 13 str. CFBP 6927]|uniref:Uncharacterized protein n=1 Tax=Agrobacterium genomosp. 13 str. CFBP 6927 TaxID=1183428 RepID=A0ABP2BQ17_9HYPH|nr:hypothetical protein AGR13a_Lc30106 [Agrobacterium genomosp. 13 str. CFBP 6927]
MREPTEALLHQQFMDDSQIAEVVFRSHEVQRPTIVVEVSADVGIVMAQFSLMYEWQRSELRAHTHNARVASKQRQEASFQLAFETMTGPALPERHRDAVADNAHSFFYRGAVRLVFQGDVTVAFNDDRI